MYEEATRTPLIMSFPGKIAPNSTVDEAVSHLDIFATIMDYVGPDILLDKQVQDCCFIAPERINMAFAKQALRASQNNVWTVQCRGKTSVDRILVEGCGTRDANGLYYRIAGLANRGGLYSKREVAFGQENIYTLSRNRKAGHYECRLWAQGVVATRQSQAKLQSPPDDC